MELYITIGFWFSILGIAARSILLVFNLCPYNREVTASETFIGLLASVGFATWTSNILEWW